MEAMYFERKFHYEDTNKMDIECSMSPININNDAFI